MRKSTPKSIAQRAKESKARFELINKEYLEEILLTSPKTLKR